MAVTVVPAGRLTATGVLLSAVVPLPSWPKPLSPQAQAEPETTAIDPAAWVPIGDPEMIVPDSASIAASPSAARTRGPLRAPTPRGAVVRVVTLSRHVPTSFRTRVDRSLCALAPRASPRDMSSSSRGYWISLPVVAHEGGRATLVADDRNLPEERGRDSDDFRRRPGAAGQAAGGLVKTPEGIWRQDLRLCCADRCTRGGVEVEDDDRGAAGAGVHDPLTGIPSVSYTHLRAHETRHDLVCRLLL